MPSGYGFPTCLTRLTTQIVLRAVVTCNGRLTYCRFGLTDVIDIYGSYFWIILIFIDIHCSLLFCMQHHAWLYGWNGARWCLREWYGHVYSHAYRHVECCTRRWLVDGARGMVATVKMCFIWIFAMDVLCLQIRVSPDKNMLFLFGLQLSASNLPITIQLLLQHRELRINRSSSLCVARCWCNSCLYRDC